MKFWISWYQPTEDYRPLNDPPNDSVLGWWCSGTRMSDDASTLCALVNAKSEDGAKSSITIDWPEASEWRFCEPRSDDHQPGDRFPITREWEKQRMAAYKTESTVQEGKGE